MLWHHLPQWRAMYRSRSSRMWVYFISIIFFPQFNQAAALYRINSCTSPACANRKSCYNRFCCFSLLSFETKQLVACILRKLRSWFHSLMMKLFLNYSLSVRCSFEDSGFQEGSADKPLLYNCFKRDLLHWWLATCS